MGLYGSYKAYGANGAYTNLMADLCKRLRQIFF